MNRHRQSLILIAGGMIAGTADISYAIIFAITQGSSAQSLLQFVASGLLGKAAFEGGWNTAILGLLLHFTITFIITLLVYFINKRITIINRRPVIAGVLIGVVVFTLMKFVVLPLSAFPFPINLKPLSTITNLLSHMFLFGVPIAIAVSRADNTGQLSKEFDKQVSD